MIKYHLFKKVSSNRGRVGSKICLRLFDSDGLINKKPRCLERFKTRQFSGKFYNDYPKNVFSARVDTIDGPNPKTLPFYSKVLNLGKFFFFLFTYYSMHIFYNFRKLGNK